jgi:hypothetical protein
MTAPEDLFLRCNVDGGCRYLSELSKLERLIGCEATAKFYERMADRCAQQGCWALLLHLGEVARPERRPPSRFPSRAQQPRSKSRVADGKGRSAEVTPLVCSDVADIVSDDSGNFVDRRLLKISTLDPTFPVANLRRERVTRLQYRASHFGAETAARPHASRSGVSPLHSTDPSALRFAAAGFSTYRRRSPRAGQCHDRTAEALTATPEWDAAGLPGAFEAPT